MKLLSIESSAKAASVALTEDGRLLGQYYQNSALTHSRTLLPMTDALLKNLEHSPGDVDGFAVAIGPGSFTGLRIGIASVKGMALALGKPCYGVSTLEAMAYGASQNSGMICCAMDARRQQVYNALFSVQGGEITRLTEDRAIPLELLLKEVGDKQALLVGDGALLCYNYFKDAGAKAVLAPENLRYQSAWGVALLAEKTRPCSAQELTPNYIRLSQAERERLEKPGGAG